MVHNKQKESDINSYCNSNDTRSVEDIVLENVNIDKKLYKDITYNVG